MEESHLVQPISIFIGLLLVAALSAILTKALRFSYTVGLVLLGILLGLAATKIPALQPLQRVNPTPEVILYLLIPTLIFEIDGGDRLQQGTEIILQGVDLFGRGKPLRLHVPHAGNPLKDAWCTIAHWVRKCIRVPFHHKNQGLSALWALSMNARAPSMLSSSMVSMRFLVSGPVSSIVVISC